MYSLPPINPEAFGNLSNVTQGGSPPPGGEAPMDMNKYLIDKVMEIKRRMGGGGNVGALGAISEAMMQQPQPQGGQGAQPQPQPQPQQPPMRA